MLRIVSLVVLLVFVGFFVSRNPEDKVVFLDIGQGDAILLQDGPRQVLIDGGPGMRVLERLGEEMPWFDRTIEVVILTHPQKDHMEGLLHVVERYDVGMIVLPWAINASQTQAWWIAEIEARGIPYRFGWRGQELIVGGMRFEVLGPFDTEEGREAVAKDLNNASVMVRAEICGLDQSESTNHLNAPNDDGCFSLLLTGDAEEEVEKLLVAQEESGVLKADVFKAGHHGSSSSSTMALLEQVRPKVVVISSGEENRFGHPHEEVLARLDGIPILRTDEHGSVRFHRKEGQWLLSCSKLCKNAVISE